MFLVVLDKHAPNRLNDTFLALVVKHAPNRLMISFWSYMTSKHLIG